MYKKPCAYAFTNDCFNSIHDIRRENEDRYLASYKIMIPQDQRAMIMATYVLMSAIDATLPTKPSPKAISGVLRKELGYNGAVITNGLYKASDRTGPA